MEIFKEIAKSKIEVGENKLNTKRKFLKRCDNYAYQLSSNSKIIEAYSSVKKSIDKGVDNPFIKNLMTQTIDFRNNSCENTIIIKDCKPDENNKSDKMKCKLIRNLKKKFGRDSQNKSTRITDIDIKAKIALKSFAQNKSLLKTKSIVHIYNL